MWILIFVRFYRIIHAPMFLRCFASDRRHMKDSDGNWNAQPPPYDPIVTEGTIQSHQINICYWSFALENFFSMVFSRVLSCNCYRMLNCLSVMLKWNLG